MAVLVLSENREREDVGGGGGELGTPKNKSGTVEKEWKLEFERMIRRR